MELTGQLVEIFKDQAAEVVKQNSLSYWAEMLQNFNEITEEEVIDSLCYFCDVIDNTSESKNEDTVLQLMNKYVEIVQSNHGQSEDVKNTVAYGFGEFAYFLPKDKYASFLPKACGFIKKITRVDGAFTDEHIIATENAMGALAKIAYKHIDGTNVTEEDLIGVLGQMPLKADENENMKSHSILIAELHDATSVVNTSAAVNQAAKEAIIRMKQHLAEQGDDPENKILNAESKIAIQQM
jgi:hypothetical protein